MPSSWETTTLGAVSNWLSGGTPKKGEPKYWGGDIPWISANSMYGTRFSESELRLTEAGLQSGSRLAPKDTVLLLVRGGALHKRIPVGIATRDVAFNQDVKALVAREDKIRPWYLLLWLLGMERHLLDSVVEYTGIGAGKLDTKRMHALEIQLPSLSEQDEIIAVVKSIDDRIELLHQTNTTLKSIAQALFKSWFVDFDPVRAKQAGRELEGMDAATAALFPAEFEESPLGLIPKGWRVCALSELCESIFSGGTPDTRKPEYWNGTLPWFSSGETRETIVIGTEKHITEAAVLNSSTRLARPGDVLIASAGQGLTRGQTSFCAIDTYINQSVVCVRTSQELGSTAWTFYNLARRYEELRGRSDSHSIRGSLTTKLLASLRVVAPPTSLMWSFGATAEHLLRAQAENRWRASSLAQLRDTLLPRVISGKLRLPEAQEQLEDALA